MSGRTILWGILVTVCLITAAAAQPPLVLDDFESYWAQPAIETAWTYAGQAANTATPLLMSDTPAQGTAYMDFDWTINGGWANPTDPTDYTGNNQSALSFAGSWDFASYGSAFELQITVDPGAVSGVDFYLLQFMDAGGQAAQAWIPSMDWAAGTGVWWWPSGDLMGLVGNEATTFTGGNEALRDALNALPQALSGEWTDLVLTPDGFIWYTWAGSATGIDDMDAITDIQLWIFSSVIDTTGSHWPYRLDSTGGSIWPPGPNAGTMSVDLICTGAFIPEPTTIALLALGGLLVMRKLRK